MRALGVRLPVVVASFAATLALLFGLQAVYLQRTLRQPVLAAVARTPGVERVEVAPAGGEVRVDVWLGLVPNLRQAYLALEDAVRGAAGGVPVVLTLHDARTPALVADYYELDPIIQQGRVTGQFVQMDSQVAAAARRLGLDRAAVLVGNTHLYVELVAGSHYLYAILPLYVPTAVAGAAAS